MAKFCSNCGSPLQEGQDVCLKCGLFIKKDNLNVSNDTYNTETKKSYYHKTYTIIVGIIFIFLSFCVLIAGFSGEYLVENPILVFTIPGMLGLLSGTILLLASSNKNLFLVSGLIMFICFLFNFLAQMDISILGILCIIFGIINCVYSRN